MNDKTKEVFGRIPDTHRTSIENPNIDRYCNIGSVGEQKSERKMNVKETGGEYLTKGGKIVNASKVVKTEILGSKLSIIAANAPDFEKLDNFFDLVCTSNKIDGIVVLGKPDGLKIYDYWSPTSEVLVGGTGTALHAIKSRKLASGGGYEKYEIEITDRNTSKKKTLPLWNYFDWPDGGLPTKRNDFEKFVKLFSKNRKLLVHCSAGVGRTGVFAACVEALLEGRGANPQKIVDSMRAARSHMVQTPDQFDLICKFVLRNCYEKAVAWNDDLTADQLKIMGITDDDKVVTIFKNIPMKDRTSKIVQKRDRYENIGSVGKQRSKREMDAAGGEYLTKGGEAVNASKVVKKQIGESKLSILATNAPSPDNFKSFLNLICTSQKVDGIVVLGKADGKKIMDYWAPNDKDRDLRCKPSDLYHLESKKLMAGAGFNAYMLDMYQADKKLKELPLWNYYYWPTFQNPVNPDDFEKFVRLFKKNRKLLVHCSAGTGRTGVFAACVQALREGKGANPKEIVESMRNVRSYMVQTSGQFDLVCKFILRNCYNERVAWNDNLTSEQLKIMGITEEDMRKI